MIEYLIFLFCFNFIQVSFTKSIPSFIPLCKRNDPNLNECFIKSINEVKPYLAKGIPEMELPPAEPLHYRNVTAKTNEGSSVALEGYLWNQVGDGLTNFDFKTLDINLDIPKLKTSFVFPYVRLRGDYQLKGSVLLFTIDTQGQFDVNSTDVACEAEWKARYYMKNGKQHIEIEKIDLKIHSKKISVFFSNLINGNEMLTETVNQAINDNMDAIQDELNPITAQSLSELSREYYNRVFSLFPIDQLFPRD